MDTKPWTVKYQPKTVSDIQGQDKAVSQLLNYVKNYSDKKKRAALLYGPPGSGKTSSIYAVANELKHEVIEVNASDTRNKSSIKEKLGPAILQRSLFAESKLILVDEIDGLAGRKDRGGVAELAKLLKKSTFPIIMTANDPWDKKLSSIRNKAEMIEFSGLNYKSVQSILRKIVEEENIKYDKMALASLARRAGGDLRGAVSDLQTLTQTDKKLTKEEVDELSGRKQKETIFNALKRVFKTTKSEVARGAFDDVDEDVDEIILWIDENLPKEYKNPLDLAKAYNNLSTADVYRGRIRRRQHWRFLVYIYDLLTAGIALSKKKKYIGFTNYSRTRRILKI